MHRRFLQHGGKMGKIIRTTDWSTHHLGSIDTWPQSLQSALGICLHSKFPISVYWGRNMTLFYNDAWSPILADKHPYALGLPAREAWSDIWELIGEPMRHVMETGQGTLNENTLLPMKRRGFTEECYFDYTFNPIFDENDEVVGILNVGTETTSRTLSKRRNEVYRKLSEKSISAESPEEVCIIIANTLTESPEDVPYALIYLYNADRSALRLATSTSVDLDSAFAPDLINLANTQTVLPFRSALRTRTAKHVRDLDNHFTLPGGVWDESSREAVLMPIVRPHSKELYGVMVFGVSPRLPYDKRYEDFFFQITEQTAFALGVAYDQRHKLNLEAREHVAREQLQTALSSGAVGVWSWDILSNKVYADKNLAKRFGIDARKAAEGLSLEVFTNSIHPDDRKRIIQQVQKAANKTKSFEEEYRTIDGEGKIGWVIARGKVEDDEDGKPVRFPGVIVDITERKKIEHELASVEQMFSALFESNIIGVAVARLDGQIENANQTFLRMFGYTRRELKKGITADMITPTNTIGVPSQIHRDLRKKGEAEPTEKEYVRKDGTVIPVLVGAVIIPGSSDRFVAFMLDISEQRQLQALNKAKDEFISIASHQLRTPATGVKQYLGMLLEGYVGEFSTHQYKVLKTAYESNERQLTIVNDLLHVAQADASDITLNPERVDIVEMVQDVINEQRHNFEDKNQIITFDTRRHSAVSTFDPFYIRMVFENIIDNAHKYTPEGKKIMISLRMTKLCIVISVKDQGVGIRKKDRQRLFKKFSRIENPLSMTAGGTGLGLYWVKKIVELHHGTIEVNSQVNKGTEFVISLPKV